VELILLTLRISHHSMQTTATHIPCYNMLIVLAENWIVLDENCFSTTLTMYSSEFSKKKKCLRELRVKDNSLSLEVITSESLYQAQLVMNDLFSRLPWMQYCEARSTRSFTLKIPLPLYSRLIFCFESFDSFLKHPIEMAMLYFPTHFPSPIRTPPSTIFLRELSR
jgi:hypothetical protein